MEKNLRSSLLKLIISSSQIVAQGCSKVNFKTTFNNSKGTHFSISMFFNKQQNFTKIFLDLNFEIECSVPEISKG